MHYQKLTKLVWSPTPTATVSDRWACTMAIFLKFAGKVGSPIDIKNILSLRVLMYPAYTPVWHWINNYYIGKYVVPHVCYVFLVILVYLSCICKSYCGWLFINSDCHYSFTPSLSNGIKQVPLIKIFTIHVTKLEVKMIVRLLITDNALLSNMQGGMK